MSKLKTVSGDAARNDIKTGIDLVANTVKQTLGPRGRNVVLDTNPYGSPINTNDGVTIAREVHDDNPFIETGVKIVKAVAEKTNDVAGDGTTTASLLMQAITTYGLKQINNGADLVLLRKGINRAADAVVEALDKEIVKVEDLESLSNVATISCGDAKVGQLVAEVVHKVGSNGVVTLEDSEGAETTNRMAEGIELRGGIQLPVFITNQVRQEADLKDVPILVTDHDITNGFEVLKLMEVCSAHGHKTAVLIANSVVGEAMITCAVNKQQGKFTLIPVKVMAHGDQGRAVLEDVAIATGGEFYSKDAGYKLPAIPEDNYNFDLFGHAERVIATKDRTTILGGSGSDLIEDRVKALKAQRKNAIREFEKHNIDERIAKLQAGVGVVRVGGVTDAARQELKLRVEDAINACKAALDDGVIAGGGSALLRAAKQVELETEHPDEQSGVIAVINACQEPLNQMAKNSGISLERTDIERVIENSKLTFDFNNGEVVNAIEAGIIDPALVAKSAIKNAASEAGLFVITESVIAQPEDTSEKV